MNGHPQAIQNPYALPPSLTAPAARPPPSTIPTDRLANQADRWLNGTSSPAPSDPRAAASPSPGPAPTSVSNAASHYAPALPPLQQQVQQAIMSQNQQNGAYGGGQPWDARASYVGPPAPGAGGQGMVPLQPGAQAYASGGYGSQPIATQHQAQSSYYNQQQPAYGQFPPAQQPLYAAGAPPPPPPPQQQQPLYGSTNGGYAPPSHLNAPSPAHPPRTSSAATTLSLDSLSLNPNSATNSPRRSLYASPEDGPPHKLAVTHPDQKMLERMRETANSGGGSGDMSKKVAWAKQVLKYIERHQSSAGESSRINDPTLVRWTDEALNHILSSASSSNPVPLALYLRGELSSSGSFPSYRSKDPKTAFRDFEAAANAGYEKAWFRIGRAYEDFGDVRRAVGAYERGIEKGDCGSTYRLAMAYLLGQIGVKSDPAKAIVLLKRAADTADLDTPQPPYILGMLLSGEFESPAVQLPKDIVPQNIDEAKSRIERAAFLSFGPAQYKMGFSYEYATLGCLFDPLLSVQYYALASQNGEVEADMALSKWYLCGSDGNFDKDEGLAVTFAEKAASRQLPSAEFALGYYREVGINGVMDLEQAKRWYTRAAGHGNQDARERLEALASSETNVLNRVDHEHQIDTKLVRKRTQAAQRSNVERERMAASNLAASLGGGPAMQQPQGGGGRYPQSQYAQGGGAGPRYNGSMEGKLRRQNTLNQVQEAARMGGKMLPLASSTSSASSVHSMPPRQGSAMSMLPPQGPPQRPVSAQPGYPNVAGPRPPQQGQAGGGGGRPQQIDVKVSKPATFAEMGIQTSKAKKDDCIIM